MLSKMLKVRERNGLCSRPRPKLPKGSVRPGPVDPPLAVVPAETAAAAPVQLSPLRHRRQKAEPKAKAKAMAESKAKAKAKAEPKAAAAAPPAPEPQYGCKKCYFKNGLQTCKNFRPGYPKAWRGKNPPRGHCQANL